MNNLKIKNLIDIKSLIYAILWVLPLATTAQSLKEVTHHSPNVSSLGKFGEVPVGHYTGVPNISIPIHEAVSGSIRLPVSLDYHAGGVKVEEVASNVGLSWALQAGGVISRSVRGYPDFESTWSNVAASGRVEAQMPMPSEEYLIACENGAVDGEADIYNFNFNGRSGKFIFGQDGSVHMIPKSNLLITALPNSFSGWKIVDEMGTQYLFGKVESTHTIDFSIESSWVLTEIISSDGKHKITFTYTPGYSNYVALVGETKALSLYGAGDCPIGEPTGLTTTYVNVSTQRLVRIDYESGHIHFNYFNERCDMSDKVLDEIAIYSKNDLIKKFVLAHSYFGTNTTCHESQAPLKRLKLNSVTEITASESKPPYIFTYNESLTFPSRLSLSQDHWGYFNDADNNTLIPGGINGPLYNFNGADRRVNPAKSQIGILKSIQYPTGGTTNFEYESNSINYSPLEHQNYEERTLEYVFAQANIPVVNMQIPLSATPLIIPASGATVIGYTITGLDSSPWPFCDISGVYLTRNGIPQGEKLTNESGPYLFTWQMQEGTYGLTIIHDCPVQAIMPSFSVNIRVKIPVNNPSNVAYAGGLRIKKIVDNPADGGVPVVREFKYNQKGSLNSSSGGLVNLPIYTRNLTVTFTNFVGPSTTRCQFLVATSQSKVPLSTTSGSYVGYNYVTEAFSNGGENRYSYYSTQGSHYSQFPYAPLNIHEWRRGFLSKVETYSKVGDQLLLAKESSYTFAELNESLVWGLKVGRMHKDIYKGEPPFGVLIPVMAPDSYTFYPTHAVFFGLGSTIEKVYPEPGNLTNVIETKKEYTYDPDHFQLIEEKETLTDGTGGSEVKIMYKKYPQDYTFSGTPVDAEAQGIKKLNDLHVVSLPVEEYVVKQYQNSQNQVSNQRVISGLFRSFKTDMPYPDQIYRAELDQPVARTDFNSSSILNNALQKSPLYKSRVKFLAYDGKGNLLAQQKTDDAVISYLWGYDDRFPIAEVKNATNASTTKQFSYTNHGNADITNYVSSTPILPAFEITSSQQISVYVGLQGAGTNIPDVPLVNVMLRTIDGIPVSDITGVWGQNTYSIAVSPGVYQWYYSTGDVSFSSPGFTSTYFTVSNTYSSGKKGSKIFYTSFEDDGNHTDVSYMGEKAWQGQYTFYLPANNGSYTLTYMKWNGGSPENWEYVTIPISVTSGVVQAYSIGNATSIIDEVRFYPAEAQMTTFAYKPEFGLTASADVNCLVTYYDYDSFGRLKHLKDNTRSIVKSFDYHYKDE